MSLSKKIESIVLVWGIGAFINGLWGVGRWTRLSRLASTLDVVLRLGTSCRSGVATSSISSRIHFPRRRFCPVWWSFRLWFWRNWITIQSVHFFVALGWEIFHCHLVVHRDCFGFATEGDARRAVSTTSIGIMGGVMR